MFDYLSTVSGGGYIGSWLAAWVQREESLRNVEKQLAPNRLVQSEADRYAPPSPHEPQPPREMPHRPCDQEPEPVHHLRAYSRYLSPRFGLSSPDAWTLFAINFRNLFANALYFVPMAIVAVCLWRALTLGNVASLGSDFRDNLMAGLCTWRLALTALTVVCFAFGLGRSALEDERLRDVEESPG